MVSFFWFFIFFVINNINVIVSKCNPGWLPSETCWLSMGYFSFIQKNPPDFISVGFYRYCWCSWGFHWYVGGTVLRCGALLLSCWLCVIGLFRSRRPLFIWGSFEKSVMSTMLSSVSVSKSSSILVFFRYGELDLGSGPRLLATLASHIVASCSISLFSSSKLRFHKEGGVTNSIGGIFSLSELNHSSSLKYLGLYSCSVWAGAWSRVWSYTVIVFLRSQNSWKFLGNLFPIFSLFLPWVELFSPLFSVLYQCMVSCFCLDF